MSEEVIRSKKKPVKKKKAASSSLKLTSEEKKLVRDYRKCSAMEKMLIRTITEKASGTITKDTDLNSLKNLL